MAMNKPQRRDFVADILRREDEFADKWKNPDSPLEELIPYMIEKGISIKSDRCTLLKERPGDWSQSKFEDTEKRLSAAAKAKQKAEDSRRFREIRSNLGILAPARNDDGNIDRMTSEEYNANLKYKYSKGLGWTGWTGKLWEPDITGLPELFKEMSTDMENAVEVMADDDPTKETWHAFALNCGNANRLETFIRKAAVDPRFHVDDASFDVNSHLLNLYNGTLNLNTGELGPHSPGDYLTKMTPILYDPKAECPEWRRALNEVVPDRELRQYLARIFGKALLGLPGDEGAFLFIGDGANGKSLILKVMSTILGPYSSVIPMSAMSSRTTETSTRDGSLSRLRGMRLVTGGESAPSEQLRTDLVKQLTTPEPFPARTINGPFIDITPTWVLILTSNHDFHITDSSHGLWRRIHRVPFTVTVPREEQVDLDTFARGLVVSESSGILNWMLDGLRDYKINGLADPYVVRESTKIYRDDQQVQEQFDVFLSEMFEATNNSDDEISGPELRTQYDRWLKGKTDNIKPHAIASSVKRMTGMKSRKSNGKSIWQGLKLRGESTDI